MLTDFWNSFRFPSPTEDGGLKIHAEWTEADYGYFSCSRVDMQCANIPILLCVVTCYYTINLLLIILNLFIQITDFHHVCSIKKAYLLHNLDFLFMLVVSWTQQGRHYRHLELNNPLYFWKLPLFFKMVFFVV